MLRAPVAALAVAVAAPAAALAGPESLPQVPAGPRPGPDILYERPARAPQLTNSGVWRAPPIMVSGATAYRRGEFLYQDFLYDDHGANGGSRDPDDPRAGNDPRESGDPFSEPNGTYTYPNAEAYAHNAADLVELRVKPLRRSTLFRITLNTLLDPELVGATIAIGDSPERRAVPHGANVSAPAKLFLTVHGEEGELVDAATGELAGVPRVRVDRGRRQIKVQVSHAAWNPGRRTVRLAAGVGLWDTENDRYLIPQRSADEDTPGGAGDLERPPAFFNVAFRTDEPFPEPTLQNQLDPAWWRDRAQGRALRDGDLGRFHAEIDFAKLRARRNDNSGVPQTGPMDRILPSHFQPHPGLNPEETCDSAGACTGILGSTLQPYAIYVPKKPAPARGFGLTLLLHSRQANYNQFLGTHHQAQFGERGDGSIVITPEGRGPDGWYYDLAGADTFEVWADVAKRYRLDPERTVISGYSMGGYGTFKLAAQFPDLFARAQTTVAPPAVGVWIPPSEPSGGTRSNTFRMLDSLRHIPFLMWAASADELVPLPGTQRQADGFDALGYRYEFDVFAPADHLTLAFNDEYGPAAEFLRNAAVDRDPPHVTYVVNPTMDFPDVGTVADHAYWLSGLELRDSSGAAPLGTIDVLSHGFGVGDPPARPTQRGAGTLTGGTLPALGFTRQSRSWGATPETPVRDLLEIEAENVRTVTIHPERARVSCDAQLDVETDGPLTVTLAGCERSETFGDR